MPSASTTNTTIDLFIHMDEVQGQQHAYLSIRPNTRIANPTDARAKTEILAVIEQLIENSTITHGLLAKKKLREQVELYLDGYRKNGEYRDYFTFSLAAPTLPVPGSDSTLEELINLELKAGKIINEKTGKIDFRDLGFSEKLVHKGSKLLVVNHATKGIDGTTIHGGQIHAEPGKELAKLRYDRKSIIADEQPEKNITILKALIDGFLYREETRGYFIDPDVLVQQVDFSTGNIAVKDYSTIATSIKVEDSSNVLKDSVKAGFTLKANGIRVTGNVGRGAILEGDTITINGIVDPEARIIGRHITIDKVVGARIEGHEVTINEVIRNAIIIGHQVKIKTCMSSTIQATEVHIAESMHAGTVTAGTFIYCHGIHSSGKSVLQIDPFALPDYQQREEKLNEMLRKSSLKRDHFTPKLVKNTYLRSQLETEIAQLLQNIEEQKNISLTNQQKTAIRQLITSDRAAELSERLHIPLASITLKRLHSFYQLTQEHEELKKEEESINREIIGCKEVIANLRQSFSRGLILADNGGDGEVHINFGTFSRRPTTINTPTLFSFSRNRKTIIATTGPLALHKHDQRLASLSPEALKLLNRFSASRIL
ncbi:MAG: DUF342 domain-containing protein [Deltaproteobacteria bacterium]|nr:DUF342 domain-containing protein [Candidatus Anaeroferrophillus wilburensis]MBN2889659.1 DUF342 domain-containing protein [Deltaproteobacteria bacterium]